MQGDRHPPDDLCMRQLLSNSDRGAGLVEYGLVVMLIAMVSLVGVQAFGEETSESFDTIGTSLATAEGVDEDDSDMTPEEKWEQAKKDYDDAIADAKQKKADDIADAKADYDAARQANKDLPKDERKAANQQAKSDYNSAKSAANAEYKSSVQNAKDARNTARDEYRSTR